MNELLNIAGAITAVSAAATVIWKVHCNIEAVIDGIRCQLRTEMLRTYYRHKEDKKIRQYEMENFEHNYCANKSLGGNSFIENVYEEVCTWEMIS